MTVLPSRGTRYVLPPGDGQHVPAGTENADQVTLKARGEQTFGQLSFLEYTAEPRSHGVSVHSHESHEEAFYVVSGTLNMQVGEDLIEVPPRGFALVPRGAAHGFWNESDTATVFVATFSPPGFEEIFFETERLAEQGLTPEEWMALQHRYGVTVLAAQMEF
jgi:quercetin dioxygenase-like cupin family protein